MAPSSPQPDDGQGASPGKAPAGQPKFELVPPAPLPPRSEPPPATTLTGQTLADPPPPVPPAQPPVAPPAATPPGSPPSRPHRLSKLVFASHPGGRSPLILWAMLAVCLLLACPAGLLDLSQPLVIHEEEAVALATLRETHARWLGQGPQAELSEVERLVPFLQGQPLDQPPALTWLQLIAVNLSADAPATAMDFILAGRGLSFVLGLLTIACVFWSAQSIGGHRAAFFAGLIAATNPYLLYFGRLATPAILVTALTMLAIASALWAIRPLRATPSVARQGLGWLICGLALGAATFTIGLGATLIIILPILLMLLLCPERISHLMGLIAAMLIAALMIVTWIAFSQAYAIGVPWWWKTGAFTHVWLNHSWADLGRQIAWTPLLALAVMLPWSIWLLGAICQPFSSSSAGGRLRMFIGWGWFLTLLVLVMLLPAATSHTSLLVMAAAASVMVGLLVNQYNELASVARYPRFWRILRWYHLLLVTLLSIAVPLTVHHQAWLVESGWVGRAWVSQPAMWQCILWGALLLAVMALSFHWAMRNYPARATAAWALWTTLLLTGLVMIWADGPASSEMAVDAAQAATRPAGLRQADDTRIEQVRRYTLTGDSLHRRLVSRSPGEGSFVPIYWLPPGAPSPDLILHVGVFPTPIDSQQLAHLVLYRQPFGLLASEQALLEAMPRLAGQSRVGLRMPDGLTLWSFRDGDLQLDVPAAPDLPSRQGQRDPQP